MSETDSFGFVFGLNWIILIIINNNTNANVYGARRPSHFDYCQK